MRVRLLGYILATAAVIAFACSCSGPEDTLYRETRTLMGTYVTVTVETAGLPEILVRAAVRDAFSEIERVDALMSTYKPESDLSRVNASAGMGPVKVDPEVADTVKLAIGVADETGGCFDPTVGPLVRVWGIASKDERVPSDDEIRNAMALVGYKHVEADSESSTVDVTRKGMSVDLGGIAKGYASDLAVDALRKAGVAAGIVAVAGDLRFFGKRADGEDWAIGINHPRVKDTLLAKLRLTDAAISTSGDYERFFMKDGVRYHHIIDPRTGRPARGLMSVTVLAPKSYLADSLATGLFVMGPDDAMRFAQEHPEIEVLMVKSDGEVLATGRFKGMEVAMVEPDRRAD